MGYIKIICFIAFFISYKATAQEIKQFVFENDFIAGTDEHYTNGVYYSWMNDENVYIPSVFDFGTSKKSKSITVTHMMFTPSDLSASEPINTDIPYAGYLGIDYRTFQYDKNYFHEIGYTLGLIGKYTYAKEFQIAIHKLTGNEIPEGWHNQLSSHLTPGINYQFGVKTDKWKFEHFDLDLSTSARFTLGEMFTGSKLSWNFRIGNKLRDNFKTSGDFLGGMESFMLNYKSLKGFYWSLTLGSFVNKINHFYITEASSYYEVDTIDYVSGDFFAYSVGYNSFDVTFHMKKNYFNGFSFDNEAISSEYGGLIVTWEF